MSKRQRSVDNNHHPAKKVRSESDDENNDPDETNTILTQPDFHNNATMGEEAEVGIVENVTLRNFLCHDRLCVDIGPRVNFLIGKNGSGKSAILTGMVVALGGKAAATDRGKSMKGLVKTGRNVAEVHITLRNKGPDAYKRDIYGNKIIVERKMTAEGSGGYKIKSATGKVISTKREELNHILDQFNIQVDNPIAILNQSTSKHFLHSKNPKDKYKFFLKATQLEQMKHDYHQANESKKLTRHYIEQKQKVLPLLEKDVQEWEIKYQNLEALEELRAKVKSLQNEAAWALVTEKERGIEPITKELRQEDARTPKFVQKVEASEKKVQETMADHKRIQEEMKALAEGATALQEAHDTARNIRDETKKIFRSIHPEKGNTEQELKSAKKDLQQIETKLRELRNSTGNNWELEKKLREEKVQQIKREVEGLQAQITTTQHDMDQFQYEVTSIRERLYALGQEEQAVLQRRDQVKRQLTNLESARSNKMRRFGQHMPDVIKKIDEAMRQRKFHQRPRGPLGASLTLTDQSWAPAAEVCIRPLIHSFCCTDHHDERQLEEIFKTTCPQGKRPTIIVSPFRDEVYDVRHHKAQAGHNPTLFDLIQTDDPVVMNCLIDQRAIESVVMFKDVKEARNVMLHKPPKNCREGFTITGDQLYASPFRYYSNKNIKANFLTASLEDDIRNTKEEAQAIERELVQKRSSTRPLQQNLKKNESEVDKCKRTLLQLRNRLNHKSYEVTELQSAEPEPQDDIATLEVDKEACVLQVQVLNEKLAEIMERYNEARRDSENADAAFAEAKNQLAQYAEGTVEIKERLATCESEIDKAKQHKKHYEDKYKEHQKKIAELKKRQEVFQAEIDADIAKASQICERIRTRRTSTNLQSEIHQINKRISMEEKTRGSREEITRTYFDKSTQFKKINSEINQLNKFNSCLEKVIMQRQAAYHEFRRMIAMRAKYFFIMLLANRGYTGKMVFDHKTESLLLNVNTSQNENTDIRSLSGGERSFSTVCFILSLWEAMESPFRMLDEFDVYMDMVNRRISMELMMLTAAQQPGRQFIFLTPNDMSYLGCSVPIRIMRLDTPVRDEGQPTLPQVLDKRRKRNEDDDDESS